MLASRAASGLPTLWEASRQAGQSSSHRAGACGTRPGAWVPGPAGRRLRGSFQRSGGHVANAHRTQPLRLRFAPRRRGRAGTRKDPMASTGS